MSLRATASFEGLEDRLFMSTTVSVVGTTLVITGTGSNDHVALTQNNGILQVKGIDTGVKVKNRITAAVTSVKFVMGAGDDIVEIMSNVSVKNFSFNGGSGDNQLLNQGNVAASGSITVAAGQAIAATSTFQAVMLDATAARAGIGFSQTDAAGATGGVTFASADLLAIAAQGQISVTGINGIAAQGTIQFVSNVVAGNTVTLTDGNPLHAPIVFTAVAVDAGVVNTFVVGATRDISMANFAAAVEAANLAGNTDINRIDPATGLVVPLVAATISLFNTPANGALGNGGIATTGGASVSISQMHNGVNPAKAGDTITLNDGVNPVQVFTAVDSLPAAAGITNPFLLVAGDQLATLTNLEAAINAPTLPGTQKFFISSLGINFDINGNPFIQLTNQTIPATATSKGLGKFGNQPITFNAAAWQSATLGMTGGANDFVAGDTITLSDGIVGHAPRVFTAVVQATPLTQAQQASGSFLIVANDAASTMQNLVDAINFVSGGVNGSIAAPTFIVASVNGVNPIAADLTVDSNRLNYAEYLPFGPDADLSLVGKFAAQATNANTATQTPDADAQFIITNLTGGVNGVAAANNDTVTLNDGVTTTVFTAVTAITGANQFLVAPTALQQAQNFVAAVNASGMNLVADVPELSQGNARNTFWDVTVRNTKTGPVGNTPIFWTSGAIFPDAAFTGGANSYEPIIAGNFIAITDGVGEPVFFTAVTNAADAPTGSAKFLIGANAQATAVNLVNAINAYSNAGVKLNLVAGLGTDIANTDNAPITLTSTMPGAAGEAQVTNWTEGVFTEPNNQSGSDASLIGAGSTVKLNDGTTTKTLTAVSAGTVVGANQFSIGTTQSETVTNLVAAINASGLNLLATDQGDGQILVENTQTGVIGNQQIVVSDPLNGQLGSEDMTGGSSGTLTAKTMAITNTGYGDNIVDLVDAVVTGNLTVSGGSGADNLTLTHANVGGKTRIALGNGVDTLTIDASTFKGSFSASTGKDDDQVVIDANGVGSTFKGSTRFADSDLLLMTDSDVTKYLYKPASTVAVTFSGGSGSLLNASGLSNGVLTSGAKAVYNNVNG